MKNKRINNLKAVCFCFIFLAWLLFLWLRPTALGAFLPAQTEDSENYVSNLSLIGVIVSQDNSSSLAVLKTGKNEPPIILASGESINNLKLIQIFDNRIILQRDSRTIEMFLGRSHKIGSIKINGEKWTAINPDQNQSSFSLKDHEAMKDNTVGSNKYLRKIKLVRSDVMTRIASEWAQIIKETKFSPHLVQGKISGFKITKLPQKSIVSNLGIYNNDIIKEVNGTKLDDMKTIFRLYNELRNEDEIEVKIERKGKLFYILYTFK